MIKNIALATIFALVSVVSFTSSSVNAASSFSAKAPPVGAPVMKGFPITGCRSIGCM